MFAFPVFNNARYHHAKLGREWLARSGCRIKVHFIPIYNPKAFKFYVTEMVPK